MFEKEAKKWVKENTETDYKASYGEFSIEPSAKKSFSAGAEFGYNKANEWHKADEKPKVTKEYLVYLISGYNCRSVTMMIYNAERGFWCADNQNDVVYWKEIALPKECV